MGVINLTPNSFSDGGQAFTQKWWDEDFDIFDIGAESTAPFNDPISDETERQRLDDYLFPHLDKLRGKILSLDSYKLKTMESFLEKFKNFNLIINDVSGQLDAEYLDLLKRYPKAHFVLSHNLVPSRSETSNHIKYALEQTPDLKEFFSERLLFLKERGLEKRVIFDPCFGFAKNRQQNIQILKELPNLIKSFDRAIPWLIGVSRKSFLRNPINMDPKTKSNQAKLDNIGSTIIAGLMKELKGSKLIMRVHTSDSFDQAELALKYL